MMPHLENAIHILWQRGRDTMEISERTGLPEHVIYNTLARAREEQRSAA